jgi:hypothetical protein
MKQRKGSLEDFLLEILHSVPALKARMMNARLHGNLEATGNYSYECREHTGPALDHGRGLRGFLDPVFSSGVYLAMHRRTNAAGAGRPRAQGARERAAATRLRCARCARAQGIHLFIVRFTTPGAGVAVRESAQRDARGRGHGLDALGPRVRRAPDAARLRVFKALYYITSFVMWRAPLRYRRELRALEAG